MQFLATFLLFATAATGVMSQSLADRPADNENCNAGILLGTKNECEAVMPTGYLACKVYTKNNRIFWMPCKPL